MPGVQFNRHLGFRVGVRVEVRDKFGVLKHYKLTHVPKFEA